MILRYIHICLLLIIRCTFSISQERALFMFTCEKDQTGYRLRNPELLSDFIRESSISNPHFINPDSLLVIHSDGKNSDIYLMNLESQTVLKLTGTPDLEFYPQKQPGANYFSCLVEDTVQFTRNILWSYPKDLKNGGREVYSASKPILSYCWIQDSVIAVVIGDDLPELYIIGTGNLSEHLISGKVTPSIKKDKNNNLYYLYQYDSLHRFIKKVEPASREIQIVKKGPPRGDVLEIIEQDTIIIGAESKIYILNKETNDWDEVADLNQWGIAKITELAFNGIDKLVVVANLE